MLNCVHGDVINVDVIKVSNLVQNLKNVRLKVLMAYRQSTLSMGPDKLIYYICLLFNTIFVHSYLPKDMMKTVVVPVIKNKSGNATSKYNYSL